MVHSADSKLRPVPDGRPHTSDKGTGAKENGKVNGRSEKRHQQHLDGIRSTRQAEEDDPNVEGEEEEEEEEAGKDNQADDEQQKHMYITAQHTKIFEQYYRLKIFTNRPLKDCFPTSTDFDDFVSTYDSVFNASGDNQQTLLHQLAAKPKGRLLVAWLVDRYPELPLKENAEGNTALYVAAASNKKWFIKTILETSPLRLSALGKPGKNGTPLHKLFVQSTIPEVNVLHKALKAELDPQQQNYNLVKEIFRRKDKEGLLPLHVAINTTARYNGQDQDDIKKLTNLVNLILRHDPTVLNEVDGQGKTPLHHAISSISKADYNKLPPNIEHLISWVREVIYICPGAFFQCASDGRLPYLFLETAKEKPACQELVEEMKRLYIRESFSYKDVFYSEWDDKEKVVKLLSDAEKSVYFDLSTISEKNLSYAYFQDLTKHIRFETILHHVDLPDLTVTGGENLFSEEPEKSRFQAIQTLIGPVDFLKIFGWLRTNGVKRIIEVHVTDSLSAYHCDEAIEMALEGFEIEKLDWERDDICSDVFFNATPDLRKVDLTVRWGTISEGKIRSFVEQFKQNLQSHRHEIEVVDRTMKTRVSSPQGTPAENMTTAGSNHPWLYYMDEFAVALKNNHWHFQGQVPEVKVAIIDDGIDSSLSSIRENIVTGTTFHCKPSRSDRPVDYWTSPGGHGTEMAKMVCRICPTARLYSIRLGEGHGENGKRQIKIDTAIKAVKWATNAGVNIISMSWSINRSNIDQGKVEEFQQCIRNAYDRGITMFCAASDLGNVSRSSQDIDIPAGFTDPLRIGTATVEGEMSSVTGQQTLDFYLPGQGISLGQGGPSEQLGSGSSLATAVAAGLAALIQYCMGIVALEKNQQPSFKSDDMKHAFRIMGTRKPNIPEVDSLFGGANLLDTPTEMMKRYRFIADKLRQQPGFPR